jgi:hypothetical protein
MGGQTRIHRDFEVLMFISAFFFEVYTSTRVKERRRCRAAPIPLSQHPHESFWKAEVVTRAGRREHKHYRLWTLAYGTNTGKGVVCLCTYSTVAILQLLLSERKRSPLRDITKGIGN